MRKLRRRRRTLLERFWSRVDKSGECWLWTGATSKGYGQFRVASLNGSELIGTHRVAWMLTNGPLPTGMEVCHRCDTPGCVRPEHLFLGTHRDNLRDSAAKGRAGYHPNSLAQLQGARA